MGRQFEKALASHRAGDLLGAERLYQGIFRRDERDAVTALNLGIVRLSLGKNVEALPPLRRAFLLEPRSAEISRAMAEAFDRLGRNEEGIAAYRRVVAMQPADPSARFSLGVALLAAGDPAGAVDEFDLVIALGGALSKAHGNAGLALKMLGRFDEAADHFGKAVAIDPADGTAAFNWGKMLNELGDASSAEHLLRRAIDLCPALAEAKLALADVVHRMGRTDDALALLDTILEIEPDHPIASVWRCVFELPVLYVDQEEVSIRRASYSRQLEDLSKRVSREPRRFLQGFASTRPFFLAYQGADDRDLQIRYNSLVQASVSASLRLHEPRVISRERMRVGIVSGYFYRHSVWKLPTRGWLVGLDPSHFEIICYHLSNEIDEETIFAQNCASRFIQGQRTLEAWVKLIEDDACDVLLYPEIGMDPMAGLLAAIRLAPVQCNGLGHPTTSGLDTIDYALSCALMEENNSDAMYTERLVRLPNISVYYDYINPPPSKALHEGWRVPAGRFVFWCGQSLFKYQPQFDDVFANIVQLSPEALFVFIEFQSTGGATEVFKRRLTRSFSSKGLHMEDYCVFRPRMSMPDFVAMAGQCNAVLDSIGWAGFNSTLESLAHNLPIVTFSGPLMRGRHGSACLALMGLDALVTNNVEEYVNVACRLASDPQFCAEIRKKVAASKQILFRDKISTEVLSDLLHSVARGPSLARPPC